MSRTRRRRTTLAVLLLSLALSGAACTGDDDRDPADESQTEQPTEEAREEPRDVRLKVRVGTVTGELAPKRRKAVARDVGRAVDRWYQAAWLEGGYPRDRFGRGAFPGFTPEVTRQAVGDRGLLTNQALARKVDDVRAVRRNVDVDLFSPAGKPSGATARFRLVMVTSGDAERRVTVQGRLLLVPGGKRWRVTGYDVARDSRPLGRPSKGEPS